MMGGIFLSACIWSEMNQIMKNYHDTEWCVPSYEDTDIFEMLTLEGAQAGLSWNIVLAKREAYKEAFHNFDITYCSKLTDEDLQAIKEQYPVIKNYSKLKSVRNNAIAVIEIKKEFESFSAFLWNYVNHNPIINAWESENQMPSKTLLSEQISKDLKKRGFLFVGPVIIYSFMQAIGMVDDHIITCPCYSINRSKKNNM